MTGTEEAREAALKAAIRLVNARPLRVPIVPALVNVGFDAGVREGIRQAREAVAARLSDPRVYTTPDVEGVVRALAAIDALEADHD